MSYARILSFVCAGFAATQLAVAATQFENQPDASQQQRERMQTPAAAQQAQSALESQQQQQQQQQAAASKQASASRDTLDMLHDTHNARQAIRQGDRQQALSDVNDALASLDQASTIAQSENLGNTVPVFAEFGTQAVIGQIQSAKIESGQAQSAQAGQPGAQGRPLTDEAQQNRQGTAAQGPVVRSVQGEFADLSVNLDTARTHLEAAKSALESDDLQTADAALSAVQSSVNVTTAEENMPLVKARVNLALAEESLRQNNYQAAHAQLQAAANALATYSGAQSQKVTQVRSELDSLLANYQAEQAQAAPRVQQMWREVAQITAPTTPGERQQMPPQQNRPQSRNQGQIVLAAFQREQAPVQQTALANQIQFGLQYGYAPGYYGYYYPYSYYSQPYVYITPSYPGFYYYSGRGYYSPRNYGYYRYYRYRGYNREHEGRERHGHGGRHLTAYTPGADPQTDQTITQGTTAAPSQATVTPAAPAGPVYVPEKELNPDINRKPLAMFYPAPETEGVKGPLIKMVPVTPAAPLTDEYVQPGEQTSVQPGYESGAPNVYPQERGQTYAHGYVQTPQGQYEPGMAVPQTQEQVAPGEPGQMQQNQLDQNPPQPNLTALQDPNYGRNEFHGQRYAPMYRGYYYRDGRRYAYSVPRYPGYYYYDGRGFYYDHRNERRFAQTPR